MISVRSFRFKVLKVYTMSIRLKRSISEKDRGSLKGIIISCSRFTSHENLSSFNLFWVVACMDANRPPFKWTLLYRNVVTFFQFHFIIFSRYFWLDKAKCSGTFPPSLHYPVLKDTYFQFLFPNKDFLPF